MSKLVQSLIGGIVKNKQANLQAVATLIKKDQDTYPLIEVVNAVNAFDIILIAITDRDAEGKLLSGKENITKVAELVSELIIADRNSKIVLLEGKYTTVEEFGTFTSRLDITTPDIDKELIFVSQLAIVVNKGLAVICRCQSLPTGLKIGKPAEPTEV